MPAANSVRSLKALSAYAAENISILVENHGGLSSDAKLLALVMDKVGMDNCGVLVDFGNFVCVVKTVSAGMGHVSRSTIAIRESKNSCLTRMGFLLKLCL